MLSEIMNGILLLIIITYVFLILMVVLIIVWSVSQISEAKGIGVIESKGVVNELR